MGRNSQIRAQRKLEAKRHPLPSKPAASHIQFKCPTTGQFVSTGISTGVEGFMDVSLKGNSFQCSACGGFHVWDGDDAVLDN